MHLRSSVCSFVLVFLAGCASHSETPPTEEAQFDVRQSVQETHSLRFAFEEGNRMLPFLEAQVGENYRSELAREGQTLLELHADVAATIEAMKQHLREPFASFKKTTDLDVKTAPRHGPFHDHPPANLLIDIDSGLIDIKKTGGDSDKKSSKSKSKPGKGGSKKKGGKAAA